MTASKTGAPGRSGEDFACKCLVASGLEVLARNVRSRHGEVDIVAREGPVTVFVEVKERQGSSHGRGHDAVTWGKRRRIISAAKLWAARHGVSDAELRFDVVSIDWDARSRPVARHDRGAFDADGR